ncbi:hypothetical protein OfM1_02670 [Lactovum odontotermitis]
MFWLNNKFEEQKANTVSEPSSSVKIAKSSVSISRALSSSAAAAAGTSEQSSSNADSYDSNTNTDFVSKFGLKLISAGTSGLGEYDAGVSGLGGAGPGLDYSWVPTEENILEYGKRTIGSQIYTYYYVTPNNPNNKDLTIDSHGFYKIGDFLLARSAIIPAGTVIHTYAGTVMVIDGSTTNDFLDFAVDQASVEE